MVCVLAIKMCHRIPVKFESAENQVDLVIVLTRRKEVPNKPNEQLTLVAI